MTLPTSVCKVRSILDEFAPNGDSPLTTKGTSMMHRKSIIGLLLLTSVGCGGAPDPSDQELGSASEEIVRGSVEADRNEVLLVEVYRADGGVSVCSGTLFAPRAVLTAAHCLEQGVFAQVYWGNDYFYDFYQLFDPYTPPENFRFSVEMVQHPRFNVDDLDSDVGVIHVDRDFPFDPMPIAFRQLSRRYKGDEVEIVGFGAEESDETNAGGPGAYTKRSGTTVFEGSPRRWPLPPNPHPGLTNPRIRHQLMQLDGMAPNSNACFGDSGGPAIMHLAGKDRIVGVMSWTGDFCEDFSYYVRINHVLPFVLHEARRARRGEVGSGTP